MNYQVNEIFTTIQGEGFLAGSPATFIRLQGCSVGCPWCDTKYTWHAGGSPMSAEEIVAQVRRKHVVITGGEPTLYDLDPLLRLLKSEHFVQLETSGQNALKGAIYPHWVTWSPKPNLEYSIPDSLLPSVSEVKWVVDGILPYEVVRNVFTKMKGRNVRFTLMPEGAPPKDENIALAIEWLDAAANDGCTGWYFGDRLQYRIGVK